MKNKEKTTGNGINPIKTCGVGELARSYFPYVSPNRATAQLQSWIRHSAELSLRLRELGWRPFQKIYTPKQVECIIGHLGEP